MAFQTFIARFAWRGPLIRQKVIRRRTGPHHVTGSFGDMSLGLAAFEATVAVLTGVTVRPQRVGRLQRLLGRKTRQWYAARMAVPADG